jgi:hypothetical protein
MRNRGRAFSTSQKGTLDPGIICRLCLSRTRSGTIRRRRPEQTNGEAPPPEPLVPDRRCGPREFPSVAPSQFVSSLVSCGAAEFALRAGRIRQGASLSIDLAEALYLADALFAASQTREQVDRHAPGPVFTCRRRKNARNSPGW